MESFTNFYSVPYICRWFNYLKRVPAAVFIRCANGFAAGSYWPMSVTGKWRGYASLTSCSPRPWG